MQSGLDEQYLGTSAASPLPSAVIRSFHGTVRTDYIMASWTTVTSNCVDSRTPKSVANRQGKDELLLNR